MDFISMFIANSVLGNCIDSKQDYTNQTRITSPSTIVLPSCRLQAHIGAFRHCKYFNSSICGCGIAPTYCDIASAKVPYTGSSRERKKNLVLLRWTVGLPMLSSEAWLGNDKLTSTLHSSICFTSTAWRARWDFNVTKLDHNIGKTTLCLSWSELRSPKVVPFLQPRSCTTFPLAISSFACTQRRFHLVSC